MSRNNVDIVEILCNTGADANAQTQTTLLVPFSSYNKLQSTALHIAVSSTTVSEGNLNIVKILLLHKADLLKNEAGLTPLDIAQSRNLVDITTELKKYAISTSA